MKAIVLNEFGSVDNLEIKEIESPTIKKNEVLVKVKAIGINPVDVKVRAGKVPLAKDLEEFDPLILGWDISGEIAEIGSAVSDFSVGDSVFGMINFVGHGKAYAEYVAAPADQLAMKPANISHEEAAASALAALTAWQALNSYGKLRPNDRLLVHAASGGVGHFAVQMAKYLGAYVIGTSSTRNKEFVLSLGADEHIDYQTVHFEKQLEDIDFVIESIGKDNFQKSVKVLKPFGTIVTLPSGHTEADELLAESKQLHACYFMSVYSSGSDMKIIADLLERKMISPRISNVYNFDQMADAHLEVETGRTVGKVVVKL